MHNPFLKKKIVPVIPKTPNDNLPYKKWSSLQTLNEDQVVMNKELLNTFNMTYNLNIHPIMYGGPYIIREMTRIRDGYKTQYHLSKKHNIS